MMPDQTLIIITVAATASQVIDAVTTSLLLPPSVCSPRLGKAETSCAILASAIPPTKLARTIPCETAFSERTSITRVPTLTASRRTSPHRSDLRQILAGTSPHLSSHPTEETKELAGWIESSPGNQDAGIATHSQGRCRNPATIRCA